MENLSELVIVSGRCASHLRVSSEAIVMKFCKCVRMLALASVAVALLAGCTGSQPSDQQVKQQAAETTAAVKQGAKQAVAATQEAAGTAVRDVNDVAAGVKEGLGKDGSPAGTSRIDLNSASQIRLATLPGISFSKAGEIVDGRPYASTHQLVSRGLLTSDQYAKIASQVVVNKP